MYASNMEFETNDGMNELTASRIKKKMRKKQEEKRKKMKRGKASNQETTDCCHAPNGKDC